MRRDRPEDRDMGRSRLRCLSCSAVEVAKSIGTATGQRSEIEGEAVFNEPVEAEGTTPVVATSYELLPDPELERLAETCPLAELALSGRQAFRRGQRRAEAEGREKQASKRKERTMTMIVQRHEWDREPMVELTDGTWWLISDDRNSFIQMDGDPDVSGGMNFWSGDWSRLGAGAQAQLAAWEAS